MDFEIEPGVFGDEIPGLVVKGELDLLASPVLKERIGELVDSGAMFVLIDLSEASFIDSTVLGVFVGANKRLLLNGGALVLVCDEPNIRTIFTLTLLDRVFEIFDSVDEAKAAMQALKEARAVDSVA
jgi:anti-sigma B factor antagonist